MNWERFRKYLLRYDDLGFAIDISRMRFGDEFLPKMQPRAADAFLKMEELEAGAIANPDEDRMVGHYWLRSPDRAPNDDLRREIEETLKEIVAFSDGVHSGKITPPDGDRFQHVLLIGIGGSALGPQFIADALGGAQDVMEISFLDNTDPDGFDRVFARLHDRLSQTMVLVVSKSGGTKETRNGMLETEARFKKAGLNFAAHAVAITGQGSALDQLAVNAKWLRRFPMWDWVGGRTSVMSAVGLVPAALQGIDVREILHGAAAMDQKTRTQELSQNAAMLLALMWYFAGDGRGAKDMVILPYKDRLALFSKYLQQLVMESLGKERDLTGKIVHQGIAVYGNKGSTDQHAYVQQLRDGVANFFVTFIEVLKDREGEAFEVEPGVTSGDYLQGFFRGTRAALYESERDSITITLAEVTPFSVGALIALYERAVGFYASLVGINAYHQPGVEAGKKAAIHILDVQQRVKKVISDAKGKPQLAENIARQIDADPEEVFHILNHLQANASNLSRSEGSEAATDEFTLT
jgi:glucose-6-phosphate isomerase